MHYKTFTLKFMQEALLVLKWYTFKSLFNTGFRLQGNIRKLGKPVKTSLQENFREFKNS